MPSLSAMPASALSEVPMYADLSPTTLQSLMSMLGQTVLPTTPYFFHSATFIFLVLLWVLTLGISSTMALIFGKRYTGMNFDQRRTSDIYILNCILTTAAAVLQFASMGSFSLQFFSWQFDILRIAATFIAGNYIFEMIYRPRMRYPMIAHHLLTLFLIMLSLSVLYEVKDPTILLSGNMLMFLATLEQPTFIALLLYRLRAPERVVFWWLRFSAVQTILFKSVAAAGAIAVWIKWQRFDRSPTSTAYNVLLWISIGGLYITQWYGAIVTYKISLTLCKRYQDAAAATGSAMLPAHRVGRAASKLNDDDDDDGDEQEPKATDATNLDLEKGMAARRSSGSSSPLPTDRIPTRTSSIGSPSLPSTPVPLPLPLPLHGDGQPQPQPQPHPRPQPQRTGSQLACYYSQPNGSIEDDAGTEAQQPEAAGAGRSGASTPASSIYEMPRSEFTHSGHEAAAAAAAAASAASAAVPRPARSARRFPAPWRKPSAGGLA